MKREQKKIFITGVAGFIGSNLARELIIEHYNVSGIDDLSQGYEHNIRDLAKSKNFEFTKADVCNGRLVERLSRGASCILHLAAHKIPRYGNALDTLRINTVGTFNCLESARKNGCKVLFASTSDIYGKNTEVPFSEDSNSVIGATYIARWAYAISKIFDEHLCYAYFREYSVPIVIVRYFGGYGPGQHLTWMGGPQTVFIDCALKKKPLPIHGNGKQTRCFIYVSDLIRGTILAMKKKEAIGHAFNIGNPGEISIIELAKLIWNLVNPGKKPKFDFIPYERFSYNYEDVMRRAVDISKSRKILGFKPIVSIEEGLEYTIDWQRKVNS